MARGPRVGNLWYPDEIKANQRSSFALLITLQLRSLFHLIFLLYLTCPLPNDFAMALVRNKVTAAPINPPFLFLSRLARIPFGKVVPQPPRHRDIDKCEHPAYELPFLYPAFKFKSKRLFEGRRSARRFKRAGRTRRPAKRQVVRLRDGAEGNWRRREGEMK